jgi:hypothetical protein
VTTDFRRRDDAEALTRTIDGILKDWIDPEGPIRPVDPRGSGDEMRLWSTSSIPLKDEAAELEPFFLKP